MVIGFLLATSKTIPTGTDFMTPIICMRRKY
jgi:hypothetical protein